MRSTAGLHPDRRLEFRYRRSAKFRRAAPEPWSVRYRQEAPEPRIPLWQTCLLAGGSSLFLWGLIGTAVWHLLG